MVSKLRIWLVLLLAALGKCGAPGQALAQDNLVLRMNRFAHTYNEFAEAHREGRFDVRLARQLSSEWHSVETSGEWPRP